MMPSKDLSLKLFENSTQGILGFPLEHGHNIIIGSENQDFLDRIIANVLGNPLTINKKMKLIRLKNHTKISILKKSIRQLKNMRKIIDERYHRLKKKNTMHLVEYNQKMYNENKLNKTLPYIVSIFEYPIHVNEKRNRIIVESLTYITQKSRAAGVIIIILTTKPSSISSIIEKLCLPNRISFRFSDKEDSLALLKDAQAFNLRNDEWIYKKIT